ncbi:MAG: hypothetical protein Edafosvirus1_129 [Edafosvirus sp.]|uniref:C2H2-type domain-containing protein n=1 Tax=Edafosvirus sp. TaxID=2487765 RepID=A0A3G4ZSD0_9VIRU|nr:MAG: hypothetical protein Edafosvirus1_129 [Edafosvirus sp.]
MKKYECKKCHRNFNHKGDYKKHIGKKKSCTIINEVKELFACELCGNEFTRKSNLKVHLENNCKMQKQLDSIKIENEAKIDLIKTESDAKIDSIKIETNALILQMQRELDKLKANTTNTMNIQNVQNTENIQNIKQQNVQNAENIQNNNIKVKMVEFGAEQLDYISDKIAMKLLNKGYLSVQEAVKQIHFNDDKPEYNNVYIPNASQNHAIVYDGKQWSHRSKTEVIDELYDGSTEYLSEKYEEFIKKKILPEYIINKIKRFLNDKDQEVQQSKIKSDLKHGLYNNRKKIIKTREICEKNDGFVFSKPEEDKKPKKIQIVNNEELDEVDKYELQRKMNKLKN